MSREPVVRNPPFRPPYATIGVVRQTASRLASDRGRKLFSAWNLYIPLRHACQDNHRMYVKMDDVTAPKSEAKLDLGQTKRMFECSFFQ